MKQDVHTIRKNFPVIGNLRYIFEVLRPEFRQCVVVCLPACVRLRVRFCARTRAIVLTCACAVLRVQCRLLNMRGCLACSPASFERSRIVIVIVVVVVAVIAVAVVGGGVVVGGVVVVVVVAPPHNQCLREIDVFVLMCARQSRV
jgi:hypothetical protein